MRLRGTGFGLSMALALFACTGKVVPLGHSTGTTQGALGQAPLPNGTCDQGLTACSGTCVDTTDDRANCGGCGIACAADAVCTAGQCVLVTPPDTECSLANVGQLCSDNSTCIPATCCDDPNGCAPDTVDAGNGAGSSSSGGSSSSSGSTGPAPTGVSRACAICEVTGGTYCAPSQNGMACPGGGVCGNSGGGGGGVTVTTANGGTTTASFSYTTCGDTGGSGDGGAGSSSSGSTGVGGSTSGGGTNGSGMSSSSSSGGTNGSGMTGVGGASSSSSGG